MRWAVALRIAPSHRFPVRLVFWLPGSQQEPLHCWVDEISANDESENTGNVPANCNDVAVGSERSVCIKQQYDSQPFVKVVPNARTNA